MRIKFEKGFTPERMVESLVNFLYENNIPISAVNIYIQTFDDEMKPAKFDKNEEYFVCKPSDAAKAEYDNYIAEMRRSRMKVVNK